MGSGHILVLLEDGDCHEASIRYAFELAKRLHNRVEVLMLLSGSASTDAAQTWRSSLQETASREGILLQMAVRRGDKASELVKHIATHPPIELMVWGGDETALVQRRASRSNHWLARIRNEIEFPVVTATRKKTVT